MKKLVVMLSLAALAPACSRQDQAANREAPPAPPAAPQPPPSPAPPSAPAAPPRPQPPAAEADPKSTQAAVELVDRFADLLNRRKFDEAYMLLGPGAPPRPAFDAKFARYSDLAVSPGKPGDAEGAAGSIYLSVPLEISGRLDGEHVDRSATAIVRRVNDVPGSTEEQRRWHIERIDWDAPA